MRQYITGFRFVPGGMEFRTDRHTLLDAMSKADASAQKHCTDIVIYTRSDGKEFGVPYKDLAPIIDALSQK